MYQERGCTLHTCSYQLSDGDTGETRRQRGAGQSDERDRLRAHVMASQLSKGHAWSFLPVDATENSKRHAERRRSVRAVRARLRSCFAAVGNPRRMHYLSHNEASRNRCAASLRVIQKMIDWKSNKIVKSTHVSTVAVQLNPLLDGETFIDQRYRYRKWRGRAD